MGGAVDDGDGFTDAVEKLNESNPTDNQSIPTGIPSVMGQAKLWLDASNIDSKGNISLNDGDAVGEWKDLSGNGYNFTQTNISNQPKLQTGVLNNFDVIEFDGEDTFSAGDYLMSIRDLDLTQGSTIYIIAAITGEKIIMDFLELENWTH